MGQRICYGWSQETVGLCYRCPVARSTPQSPARSQNGLALAIAAYFAPQDIDSISRPFLGSSHNRCVDPFYHWQIPNKKGLIFTWLRFFNAVAPPACRVHNHV